jgi:hypothetical protein
MRWKVHDRRIVQREQRALAVVARAGVLLDH